MNKIKVMHYDEEIKKREKLAYKFYELILEPDEYPNIVYDDQDLVAVCFEVTKKRDDYVEYLINKISRIYGVEMNEDILYSDFWHVLEYLKGEQIRQRTQKLLPKPE